MEAFKILFPGYIVWSALLVQLALSLVEGKSAPANDRLWRIQDQRRVPEMTGVGVESDFWVSAFAAIPASEFVLLAAIRQKPA